MQGLQITPEDLGIKVRATLKLEKRLWNRVQERAKNTGVSASRLLEIVFEKWERAVDFEEDEAESKMIRSMKFPRFDANGNMITDYNGSDFKRGAVVAFREFPTKAIGTVEYLEDSKVHVMVGVTEVGFSPNELIVIEPVTAPEE